MSTKLVTQLNPFSSEHSTEEIDNSTIEEILAKLDKGKAVNTGWRVLLNDEIITDFSRCTNDGDTLYIKLVPEGDMNQKQVANAEKITGGLMVLTGAILMLTGVGGYLGGVLIGAGVTLVAGGIALYNLDFTMKDREKPDQSPSIRGSKNQSRPLGYIPVLFGQRRIYPDLAANPYTWVDEKGDQYLYQLFCCGQSDQEIDTTTIKLGDTSIASYSATNSIREILSGNDELISISISNGQELPPLINKCVHEEIHNSVISHETEDGIDASIISTTPDNTEEINVDIFFYNGLGRYDDKGKVQDTSVTVETYYKKDFEDDSHYQLLGYFQSNSNTITGKELKTKRYSVTKSGLPKGKYTVKVSRKTGDSSDSKIIDTVYLGSIRSVKNKEPISADRCRELTLIGLKVKVSSKLNGYVDHLNFVSQAKSKIYDDVLKNWKTAATSNPASAALYAMQGKITQQKLNNSEIDWRALEKLYTWCARNNYECNEYVYESISISDILNSIGSTCRAEIIRQNGKITVIQDIERDGFVQLFTPRNSWGYRESILKADIPDAIALQLTDKESGYAQQEVKIYNTPDGNYAAEPDAVQDCPLWGVTSNVQARKLGMYKYAVTKNRPIVYNFSADFEYMLCSKGDWIKYAGDIALAGITQGRITQILRNADRMITGIYTDELIPAMETGENYAVRIRKNNGTAILVSVRHYSSAGNFLEFEIAIDDEISEGCLFLFGIRGQESIDLVITDIQCGENLTAEITAVNYAPEIFGVDSPDFVLPDFVNNITEVASMTDSGAIDQSDWLRFEVYNDNETMPGKPTGNGMNNGWHSNRTEASKWISTKTSKTIFTGEWSSPLYIERYANSTIMLYRELSDGESSMENTPGITSNLIYNFTTNQITWENESGSNRWSPINPPNPTRPVYVTSATALTKGTTDVIEPNEWSKPIQIGQNGANGVSVATIQLYKRSMVKPETPSITSTYCFNTGDLEWSNPSLTAGWQTNIPPLDAESSPIWITHATALTTNDSAYEEDGKLYDKIDADEWSNPEQYSANPLINQNRVPIMNISAPYIKGIKDENGEYITFDPPEIKLTATLFDGEKSADYKGVFEVYVNGNTEPSYRSVKPEVETIFKIPEGTKYLNIVLRDTTSLVVFDNETRNVVSEDDGFSLSITNAYQLVKNSTDELSMYIPSAVVGTYHADEKPTEIISATSDSDIDILVNGQVINFSSKSQFIKEAFIRVESLVDGDYLDVFGFDNGDDSIIIGISDGILGYTDAMSLNSSILVKDFDTETLRVNLSKATGQNLGIIRDVYIKEEMPDEYYGLPSSPNTGDYFSYAGANNSKYKNGLNYIYNGVDWEVDNNLEHQIASMPQMLPYVNTDKTSAYCTNDEAMNLFFVRTLVANKALINELFANRITISGGLVSDDYEPNSRGFALTKVIDEETNETHSFFECSDGVFRGNIETGSLTSIKGSTIPRVFDFNSQYGNIICQTLYQKGVTQGENVGTVVYNGKTYNHFSYTYKQEHKDYPYRLQRVYRCKSFTDKNGNLYFEAPSWADPTTKIPDPARTVTGISYVLVWRKYTMRTTTSKCYLSLLNEYEEPVIVVSGSVETYSVVGYDEWVEYAERDISRVISAPPPPEYLPSREGLDKGWDGTSLENWFPPELLILSVLINNLPKRTLSIDMTDVTGYVRLINPTSYSDSLLSGTIYVTPDGTLKIKQ